MELLSRFLFSGIGLLITMGSGFWLAAVGKPLNMALFNLHKLVALATVAWSVYQWVHSDWNIQKSAPLVVLTILAAVCVLALFVSGGLISAGKLDYGRMLLTHRAALAVMVIALVGWVALLSQVRMGQACL